MDLDKQIELQKKRVNGARQLWEVSKGLCVESQRKAKYEAHERELERLLDMREGAKQV